MDLIDVDEIIDVNFPDSSAPDEGQSVELVFKDGTRKAAATSKRSAGGEKYCPICEAVTPTFPHDGRAHRYQKKRKPFSEADLKMLAAQKKLK